MTRSQVSVSLCDRLSAVGIPKRIKLPIVDAINKWVKCSGPEWTITRLKNLKNDLIRSWSGLEPISEGIKYSKGIPKGPFGPLWTWTSERGKFKAVQVLMAYTSFISPSITKKQREKFVSSVVRDAVDQNLETDPYTKSMTAIVKATKQHIIVWGGRKIPDYDSYPWSHNRRQPTVRGKTQPERNENYSPYDPLHNLVLSHTFISLYKDHKCLREAVPSSFKKLFDDDAEFSHQLPVYEAYRQMFNYVDNVGKISFIQEPGYKLRAVANPLRIYQVALDPLKISLMKYLKVFPGVFVHDQKAGIDKVQKCLQEGHTVHSVDLSDATNNFPLGPQISVLREGCPYADKDAISLFEKVSRSPWLYKDEHGSAVGLTWTVGQPLGLAPSFGSFTLAHASVLLSLSKDSLGRDGKPPFAIVGDDVSIWNDTVYDRYQNFLSHWDIPISKDKTISSSLVAEFCGKIITREQQIPQLKYRMVSDNSFVDIARNLGQQSSSLFTPPQRAVLKEIAEIPEFLGGLGWNPSGKSLEQRISNPLGQELLTSYLEQNQECCFEQRSSLVNRHLYQGIGWVNERYLSSVIEPPFRPGKGVAKDHLEILKSSQVTREVFRDSEIPDNRWAPIHRDSDPRGPSTRVLLEKKISSSKKISYSRSKGLER